MQVYLTSITEREEGGKIKIGINIWRDRIVVAT